MAHVPCCELHKFTSTDGDRPTWAPHDCHQATVLTTQTFCRHLTVVNKGPLSMSIPWHGGQCGPSTLIRVRLGAIDVSNWGSTPVYCQRIVAMNRLHSRLIQTKQYKELMSKIPIQSSSPPPLSFSAVLATAYQILPTPPSRL